MQAASLLQASIWSLQKLKPDSPFFQAQGDAYGIVLLILSKQITCETHARPIDITALITMNLLSDFVNAVGVKSPAQ